MMSLWLMICGWREVICTFDAVQFGSAMQALQKGRRMVSPAVAVQ